MMETGTNAPIKMSVRLVSMNVPIPPNVPIQSVVTPVPVLKILLAMDTSAGVKLATLVT